MSKYGGLHEHDFDRAESEARPLKVYIAGPMSGFPQSNFPAFDRMAARLRAAGYDVISPAELDDEKERAAALASPDGAAAAANWASCLARDIVIVAEQVDAVVVLPGWQRSRGARLEVFTALLCKKPVFEDDHADNEYYDEAPHLIPIAHPDVVFGVTRHFFD